jgi:hypothetical protein
MQSRRRIFPSRLGLSALLGLSLVVGLAAGISAAAQERPNFTGDWTLDLKASQLHEDYRALERGVVRIEHREPAFTFRRTFFVKGQPSEASGQLNNRVKYELTDEGRTLRATEDFDGGGRSHHNVWIFRRQ